MDAVFARCEAEAWTESDDLLLQQEEAEERKADGRDAEGPQGGREQADRAPVPPEGLDRPLVFAARSPRGSSPFERVDPCEFERERFYRSILRPTEDGLPLRFRTLPARSLRDDEPQSSARMMETVVAEARVPEELLEFPLREEAGALESEVDAHRGDQFVAL